MTGAVRNFNLKVLGWFWLTLLVCILSIAIPAFILQEINENEPLSGRDSRLLNNVAQRIDSILLSRPADPHGIPRQLEQLETRTSYQWLIVDKELNVVQSSMPLRRSLTEEFNSKRFWYFIQKEQQREINLEWTRLVGPVSLTARPDWKLVLWRPERPRPLDVFRAVPWWLMLGIFMVVTSLMSWLLVRSIARPLNRLGDAFTAVGQGQLNHRIEYSQSADKGGRRSGESPFTRLFAQFNDMTGKIAALIQNQKRQSADISHELRTPLTRLQMTLALVRRKCADPSLIPLLERAEKENELLNLHIQRLSDLTTMESRAISQGKADITVKALLDDLCEDAAFEAQQLGISWQHALADGTLSIYEEPFLTAIENVVRNAFKYANSSVSLACTVAGSQLTIVIEDDGPGVEPADLSKLTNAFYRTDSARNSDTGGLGLGLAIAAEAVRLNDGDMSFSLSHKGGLQVNMQFRLTQKP